MEENIDANSSRSTCGHFKRQQSHTGFDEAMINTLTTDYRVLPLYEKKLADLIFIKRTSLRRNLSLGRRWRRRVDEGAVRERLPFEFPRVDDFHFYNYYNRYAPSQSITHNGNFQFKLVPGPGVDGYGQIPIPSDMHRRAAVTARAAILKRREVMKKRRRF